MEICQIPDFALLEDDQCIMKVLKYCCSDVVVVLSPKGYKYLVEVPPRVAEREIIVPGDYVVIQATAIGARYLAEVVLVIDDQHEMFYRTHNIWPKQFDTAGYVERLAEKVQRCKEEEEMLKKMGKKEKKEPATSKKKKKEKPCKHSQKFDKKCLDDTRLFIDDGIPLDLEGDEKQWQADIANCGTNTATNNAKTIGTSTKTNINTKSSTGCCCITCCSKKPTTNVGRY